MKGNDVESTDFHFPQNEFENIKINGHEILFHGKMYDIKSSLISDTFFDLLVVNDSKEENI